MTRVAVDPNARRKELAQIHLGVKALGWSDADYRAILAAKTGKSSAGDLDSAQRKRFIEHLQSCGWQGTKRKFSQAEKIAWYWSQLDKAGALTDASKPALLAFVGRVAGVGVSDLRFLPTAQASTVIEGLKAWLNRHQRKSCPQQPIGGS